MELPPGSRGVAGRVGRAALPDGQNWSRECQGTEVLGEAARFVIPRPDQQEKEREEITTVLKLHAASVTALLPCLAGPSASPPRPCRARRCRLCAVCCCGYGALVLGSPGPQVSLLSCSWPVWSSGSPFQIPRGKSCPVPSSPCQGSAKLPPSAVRTFFPCSIVPAWRGCPAGALGAQPVAHGGIRVIPYKCLGSMCRAPCYPIPPRRDIGKK